MRIQESTVSLQSSHALQREQSFEIEISSAFRGIFAEAAAASQDDKAARAAALNEQAQQLLRDLIEAIMAAMDGKTCRQSEKEPATLPVGSASGRPRSYDGGSRISLSERECETTSVCGRGQVKTADGRRLDFSFNTDFSRSEFSRTDLLHTASVRLKDPLILGFDGQAVDLSGQRIDFDLDADGEPEQIPGLGKGCGFLVFDQNGNGCADNGKELFGALSGDGFADLAALDEDGNGWIDEGDSAFARLGVWRGEGYIGLGRLGIGALYTGSTEAPFTLKNDEREVLGQIRAAGVYLNENGQVGRIHQVDLAVSSVAPAEGKP